MCFGHNKLLSGDVKNGQVVLRIVLPITYFPTYTDDKEKANRQELRAVAKFKAQLF